MSRFYRITAWLIMIMICLTGISTLAETADEFYLEGLYWGMTLDGVCEWATEHGMKIYASKEQYEAIVSSQTYSAVSTAITGEMFLGRGRLVFDMKYGRLCALTVYGGEFYVNEDPAYMNELFNEFEGNLVKYFGAPAVEKEKNNNNVYFADEWYIGNTKVILTYEVDTVEVQDGNDVYYEPQDMVKLFIVDNDTCPAQTQDEMMEIITSDINYENGEAIPMPTYPPIEDMIIPDSLGIIVEEKNIDPIEIIEDISMTEETTVYNELAVGSKGDEVVKLQEQLILTGFLSGAADGIYGNGTAGAVSAYQSARRLEPTGIADAETQERLFAEEGPVEPDIPIVIERIVLSENSIGDPEIYPVVKNISKTKTIDAFSFYVKGYNRYGERVKVYDVYDFYDGIWQEGEIGPGKTWDSYGSWVWTMYGLDTATNFEATIYKIHTTDGDTINIPEINWVWVSGEK